MAEHHLIDTLDEVADDIKKDNNDFDLYRTLQTYHKLREDPRPLKDGPNGWNLDKYKFLHMLLKTYRYRPDAPWYVFIEADTALIWDNLRTYLDRHDPKKASYFGSPTYLDIEFAHGGTGYIISQKAMQMAVGNHPDIATKYDKTVHDICCGDAMIGRVLLDEDIKLTKAWPLMNGEKPVTLPFSPRIWCQPVITMHHLTAQEVSQVWSFEQERKSKGIKVSNSSLKFLLRSQYLSPTRHVLTCTHLGRNLSCLGISSTASSSLHLNPSAKTGIICPTTLLTLHLLPISPIKLTTAKHGPISPVFSALLPTPRTTARKLAKTMMNASNGCTRIKSANLGEVSNWEEARSQKTERNMSADGSLIR